MSSKTEQKILDAALEVFSKNGYKGARTRIIAEKSGFTEMTLFRKFETKENLFNQVLIKNKEKIVEDFNSLLVLEEVSESKARFHALILGLMDLIDNNFKYVNIIIYEQDKIVDSVTETFIVHLGEHLEKFFPKIKIDHELLSFMILSFLYALIYRKQMGDNFFDSDSAVEEFIKYHSNSLKL
jgi:AcrR family transcriptional regulator